MDLIGYSEILIDYVGVGNLLTLLTFLICLFVSYYLYYRTFYRLVYSTGTICKTCQTFEDWKNKNNIFNTRLIIYNNGRKTITNKQLENFQIVSTKSIKDVLIVKGLKGLNISIHNNYANIEIDYLDSSDYFVIEIVHNGSIELKGRIEETGKLLYREPASWVIINVIVMFPLLAFLIYNTYIFLGNRDSNFFPMILNFVFIYVIVYTIRFIHRLFFIPDKLTAKYVNSKSKWKTEFKN